MKSRESFITLLLAMGILAGSASTGLALDPPGIMNHQGRIAISGTNYEGTGWFKFAFVDAAGTTTLWSHDGTSVGGGAPLSGVAVPVSAGHYAIGLGDTTIINMDSAIPASVFTDNVDVRLRIWFSTTKTGTYEQIMPDRRIVATGYAFNAATAQGVADDSITEAMITTGAVTSSKILLTNVGDSTAGKIRWTGTDFEGFNGTEWVSLTMPPMGGSSGGSPGSSSTVAMMLVGNTRNADDPEDGNISLPGTQNLGAVNYKYVIGKYEVTNAQYAAFLNAVADVDPNGLYNAGMGTNARGGIVRSGTSGSFAYLVKKAMGDKPVNFVSWYDAVRFCNWLHNGRPTGAASLSTTEGGVYKLTSATSVQLPGDDLIHGANGRYAGAKFHLPGVDEWYKAAYHQPASQGGDADDYWLFPTQSNDSPTGGLSDAVGNIINDDLNIANRTGVADWDSDGDGFPENGNVTTVGSGGPGSASFYGAFDMGGNINEWTEEGDATVRAVRGGTFASSISALESSGQFNISPTNEDVGTGFRVAAPLQ